MARDSHLIRSRFVLALSTFGLGLATFLALQVVDFEEVEAQVEAGEVAEQGSDESNTHSDLASVDDFLALTSQVREPGLRALTKIEQTWQPGYAPMLLDVWRFCRIRQRIDVIRDLLARKTEENFGSSRNAWSQHIWKSEFEPHPEYAEFKARLYERIDPRFREYFEHADQRLIRLDEIRWGGVKRDGIPPLKNPKTLSAKDANYLADKDIVFGVAINGEARAYPKRILAWHEMVKDVVGGESINGVYCTLCGSMIVYRTKHDGKHYELGTSGFLYRSNKLMYDHETKSLWSTIEGKPVVGPLVGKDIKLQPLTVVTTTWGAWKADHPDTRVLSLKTGHRRNYGEGVAYRDYFSTDQLMFTVPTIDQRLNNKDEVFIVRDGIFDTDPLAISVQFLKKNRIYYDQTGQTKFVVITDEAGASRAYEVGESQFVEISDEHHLLDQTGAKWSVEEDALKKVDGSATLNRLPSHRAFWFGWYSVHPQTRLVK